MKKFNQSIKIEVAVDDIAKKLLDTFPQDYKHKEMLTETIISTALNSRNISYIYNALNGYSAEIDFQVGDKVICTTKDKKIAIWEEEKVVAEVMQPVVGKPKMKKIETNYVEIGECEIVEIDLYSDSKLKVKFIQDDTYNYGLLQETESWVNHRTCTKTSDPVI